MYEVKIDKNNSRAKLIVNGHLTIQNASLIKEYLIDLLNQNELVEIDQSCVEEFDVAYIQLLFALKRSADSAGKRFVITSDDNGLFYETLHDTGYHDGEKLVNKKLTDNYKEVQNG